MLTREIENENVGMLESIPRQSSPLTQPSSEARPPIGLPRGSVRALLTLLIVAVVIVQLGRGREVELLWTETLMIALAHYFTSRRFIRLSPDVIRRLTEEGHIEAEPRPLYLPQYSIRLILVVAFIGLAVYLYRQDRLFQSQAVSILGVVFAYLLGIVARLRSVRGWEDFKAIAVLLVLLCTAVPSLMDRGELVPHQFRDITLGLVLFYFGSR